MDTAYEATKAACGDVDILINNAGIITNNKTFAEQTDKDINRTFDINTKGAMFVALRYLKEMKERGIGHICNITSSASCRVSSPTAGSTSSSETSAASTPSWTTSPAGNRGIDSSHPHKKSRLMRLDFLCWVPQKCLDYSPMSWM